MAAAVVTAVQVAREQQDGANVLANRLRYNVISTNVPGNNVILSASSRRTLA